MRKQWMMQQEDNDFLLSENDLTRLVNEQRRHNLRFVTARWARYTAVPARKFGPFAGPAFPLHKDADVDRPGFRARPVHAKWSK
jgi:hypothetical protein